MYKINKKTVISVAVKNEAKNLPYLFKNLYEIKKTFLKTFFIFVVSDSSDNSEKIIKHFLKENNGKLLKKNFKKNILRLKKLEISRNLYLNYIKKTKFLKKFDYLIVLDADRVNNRITSSKIYKSITNLKKNWTAIFANQIFFYYDIFALRIKKVFDFDCFEKIILIKKNKTNLTRIFKKIIFNNYFIINKFNNRYIKVKSAFGGFAIYKLKKVLKFKYSSNQGRACEHVYLNMKLYKKYKNLYIDKKLTNSFGINKHILNSFLCSYLNFFLNRFLNKIK